MQNGKKSVLVCWYSSNLPLIRVGEKNWYTKPVRLQGKNLIKKPELALLVKRTMVQHLANY